MNGQDLRHIGVQYFPSFVSGEEQKELLHLLASLTYRDILMRGMVAKRKVCCFGYDYVYARRAVVPTEPMPPELARLRDRAERETADGFHLCQAIVTSYPRGAGINWHVDAPTFGPSIIGVSFGGVAQLSLKRGSEVYRIALAPGSAYILRGAARDSWLHRIAPERRLSGCAAQQATWWSYERRWLHRLSYSSRLRSIPIRSDATRGRPWTLVSTGDVHDYS